MSDTIVGRTRGGEEWVPEFVTELNAEKCIGCGRCYKVCPRDVFELTERAEALADDDDFYDDDDDDDEMKVMAIKNAMDCIGCTSCAKVCPKNCLTHVAGG